LSFSPAAHELERFRVLIGERLGLRFDDNRLAALAGLLRDRAGASRVSCAQYLDDLAANRASNADLQSLAADLTVTETYFFRNADQFAALVEVALADRLAVADPQWPVHVLSAGCASGEEPYSLAMVVREHLAAAAGRVRITAVDVNPVMLEKAARAVYSAWSLRDTSAEMQARWFKQDGGAFLLSPAIRSAVTFEPRNIAREDADFWRAGRFDIVFCRNLLMYFTPEQAQATVARIAGSIVPGGYFFLGHAETLRGLSNDFRLCHTHGTFYYQRKQDAPGVRAVDASEIELVSPALPPIDATWIETIQRAAERINALAAMPAVSAGAPTAAENRPRLDLQGALDSVRNERYGQALQQLDALPQSYARDPDVLLLKAVALSHSGALRAAESVCRELVDSDDLNAGAHYVLALCREGTGDLRGALDHDQVATYLDPGFAMPRLHMGLLARRLGDRAAARRELEQAIALLQREDAARLLLFGGGFKREALVALCRAERDACEERP